MAGAALRFVGEGDGDRVVGVVDFSDEVADGELELHGLGATGVCPRGQVVASAEEGADVGGLREDEVADAEDRGGEGGQAREALEGAHDGLLAAAGGGGLAGDVEVGDAGVLADEPHEFAAAGDAGPVVELVVIGGEASHDEARRSRIPATSS